MPKKCLLVTDMLKDFIDEDGSLYCGPTSRAIIPYVKSLIEDMRAEGALIVHIMDAHAPDDAEFKMFPPHAVQDTPGAQLIDEIADIATDEDPRVKKTRYSAFFGTDLGQILEDHDVNEIHIVGVCTSICVMETVSDLRNRDYRVVVHRDGVADFDPEAHAFALRHMAKIFGAEIV